MQIEMTRGQSYILLDEKELARNQMKAITAIEDELGLNAHQACLLLRKH